ncbi:transcriptional regulator GcvA [Alloalcanivorax xenomutans]|uniref:transcriptional regulator GcvA n=1 Tax=Alloalcanivorax xenomutans TaxID=1094342 RepID=UPI003BABDF89
MSAVLPLLALRAFTEIGRHGSVKRAAGVMGVTPGAVSQQLKQLEERIGAPLFIRTRQGMQLTEAGEQVYPALLQAFEQIERSLGSLEARNARQTLTVSTTPSFAASWLVPRLGRFTERHPDIDVRVEASSDLIHFQRDRVDVAIRHGLGDYPGLACQRLMASVLVPVASPALLAQGPPIREPVDCLAFPLLQNSNRADWVLWLKALGINEPAHADRGPAFNDELLLIRAAEAGQGLALIRDVHARAEIDAGRLVLALDQPWPSDFAYYLVWPSSVQEKPAMTLFREWLAQEASCGED